MLHYSLYKNKLPNAGPDEWMARPTDVRKHTQADLIRDITGPGSILKPTETRAVIDRYWGRITDYLRRGETYSGKYISVRFSIKGEFLGEGDEFDPDRHALIVGSLPKKLITRVASEVRLRKVAPNHIVPEIDSVYDWDSATKNDRLSPGGGLEVRGKHLKIYDNLEEEEGVFFISQADDSELRATQLRTNEPKTLTLRIPAGLTPGNYRLEVRNTRYDGNTLRTGIFAPVLTIE